MPAFVPPRARSLARAAALTVIAIGMAGCSDSGRFEVNNPFASSNPNTPPADVTGSVPPRPATAKVASQPLPAPGKPQAVASSGVAQGAGGLGAYRPPASSSDITGSVDRPPAPVGHWTWEGGTPVVVGPDESVEAVGRKYGVPVSAILQANGLTDRLQVRAGQRLVIPRYVVASAPAQLPPPAGPRAMPAPVAAHPIAPELVHTVKPGESLMGISRKYGVTLAALARANKIEVYTKLKMGDQLIIPGKHAEAVKQAVAPQIAKPQVAAAPKAPKAAPAAPAVSTTQVATVPAKETVRVATPEPGTAATPAKAAEATGAMPSFRWPVHGRVISAFGSNPNGTQNDGINVAVPEGTPVKAAEDGVVAYAGNELKGYGNLILVRHSNGYVSAYANASNLLVKRGDTVKRGQVIAHSGQTGNVNSPQLHFEIRKGSTPVDPTRFLGGQSG